MPKYEITCQDMKHNRKFGVQGCAWLCKAVWGYVRLCKAVFGCARLCMAVHEWSRPYGCGLAFAFVHWGSANYTVLELPLFCVELLWRIYGEFTWNIIQAWQREPEVDLSIISTPLPPLLPPLHPTPLRLNVFPVLWGSCCSSTALFTPLFSTPQ